MRTRGIEPGVIQVFRLFVMLRLGFLLFSWLSRQIYPALSGSSNDTAFWFSLVSLSLLMVYLLIPSLPARLGPIYLPIALAIATLSPLIQQYLILVASYPLMIATGNITEPLVSAWQLFPLLAVPLVLIAVQYGFKSVLVFTILTGFIELILARLAIGSFAFLILPYIGVTLVRTLSFVLIGYIVARLMKGQREQRQALEDANQRLTSYALTLDQLATSRERNRLARELHDTIAHSLSGTAVQLEAARAVWDENPAESRQLVDQALDSTRSGLADTRRALQALRAEPLDDLGIILSLRNLCEGMRNRSGLSIECILPERLEGWTSEVEQNLFRIAQEALENVIRHAQAGRARLELNQKDGWLTLIISDDGIGFELQNTRHDQRFGIEGMQERAAMIGANLVIDSTPGKGTRVLLSVEG
jgi:signal transduction histidine kinase